MSHFYITKALAHYNSPSPSQLAVYPRWTYATTTRHDRHQRGAAHCADLLLTSIEPKLIFHDRPRYFADYLQHCFTSERSYFLHQHLESKYRQFGLGCDD